MIDITRLFSDPVFMLFAFLMVVVIASTAKKIAKMKASEQGSGRLGDEESREMQELYRGFEDLTKRVEAIETILMDRSRKR